jgi:glucosamine-6-phosphate deaminase
MNIVIEPDKVVLGQVAARTGAEYIRRAIAEKGSAAIIVATGMSQFEMLAALVAEPGVAWDKVTAFHLDEYVGMPETHPASFRKYLRERFVEQVPVPLAQFHYIDGTGDVEAEFRRLAALISPLTVDVAFIGIGENGHLAFNDPPADFETTEPYILVDLDEACRKQQYGEGWFPTLEDVPHRAISMSIHEIMRARNIICTVPDARKARAVKGALEGPVTPDVPASILQQHSSAWLLLDPLSAANLSSDTVARAVSGQIVP